MYSVLFVVYCLINSRLFIMFFLLLSDVSFTLLLWQVNFHFVGSMKCYLISSVILQIRFQTNLTMLLLENLTNPLCQKSIIPTSSFSCHFELFIKYTLKNYFWCHHSKYFISHSQTPSLSFRVFSDLLLILLLAAL